MADISPRAWGIPVVASTSERNTLFPSPATNQRVQNLETSAIERYDGTQWVTDLTLAGPGVFSVTDPRYGASASNSATANATAIQNAATAAGSDGLLYFPPGMTFATNGNLVIYGPVMGNGCLLNWSGTGDAIAIGASGTTPSVQNETLHLPRLINVNKSVTGWAQSGVSGSVGVRVRHTYNSRVIIPYVRNFESGVVMYGEHEGNDYNSIDVGHLSNNKRNLVLDATSDGYTNDNNFWGGRLSFDSAEGVNVSGTRQILISGGTTTAVDVLNNNRFRGLSLEGDIPEYHVECKGAENLWDHCRWGTSAESPKFLSNGSHAQNNIVRGGYASNSIVFTTSNSGLQPRVETKEGLAITGASASVPVLKLANQDSSSSPIMRAFPAGTDVFGASVGSNWVWELTANMLKGKATGDSTASPRIQVDPTTGKITSLGAIANGLSNVLPNIDASAFSQAIANTVTFTGPTMAAGLVALWDSNSGHGAMVWLTGGNGTVLSGTDNGTAYSGAIGTASKFNVAISSGALKIQNNTGSAAAMTGFVVKLA